jgi:hypothetical protein
LGTRGQARASGGGEQKEASEEKVGEVGLGPFLIFLFKKES